MAGTARYHIQVGDEDIVFEGPDGLTDKQIEQLGDKYLRTAKPGQRFSHAIYAGTVDTGEEPVPNIGESNSTDIGSYVRGAESGAYFNWDDELASAANAAIPGLAELNNTVPLGGFLDVLASANETPVGTQQGPLSGGDFWSRFKTNMDARELQKKADEEYHSGARRIGEVSGALMTIPAAAANSVRIPLAARTAMAARPIASGIGIGAAAGTVSGAGAGRGNRVQSAALGALTGAATGGILSGASELVPVLAQYGKVLFNHGVTKEALAQLTKAMKRDGFDVSSPAGIAKLKAALQEYTGKPVSLADLGIASRSRAGVGMRAPSDVQDTAIDTLMQRTSGQTQRLASDIRQNVAPRTDVHALNDSLIEQRAAQAKELRDRALFEDAQIEPPQPRAIVGIQEAPEAGVQRTLGADVPDTYGRTEVPAIAPVAGRQSRIVDDPELQQLVRLPDAQKALTAALERSESERALLATQGKDISHLPDLTRGSDLDVRTLDTLKRFLDDEVSALYRRGDTATFKAGQAAQVRNLRDAIRERLRKVVPEYADYLDAYKGSSEMIDALEQGQSFDKLPPEQIAAEQAGRSTAAQELYRVGTARNLLDTIRSTKDTARPANRILNSDEARSQLAATGVSPADAARLNRSVSQERTLNLLPNELAGSATAQRAMAQADADAGAHVPLPFNPGSPYGWLGAGIRGVLNHVSTARNSAVNEQLLPRIMETDPKIIDGIITEMEQHGKVAVARALRRRVNERRGNFFAGNIVGSPVALPEDGDY